LRVLNYALILAKLLTPKYSQTFQYVCQKIMQVMEQKQKLYHIWFKSY